MEAVGLFLAELLKIESSYEVHGMHFREMN